MTGLGCWTALGETAEDVFDAICAGRSGIAGMGPFPGNGPVASIDGGPHLSSTLALKVVRDALGELPGDGVALVGASTSGDMVRGEAEYRRVLEGDAPGPGFLWAQLCDRPAQIVAAELRLTGPRTSLSTACSSGAAAVGLAAEWVASGRVDRAVVLGVDALCRMTVHGFGSLGAVSPHPCRPFDAERSGLSLGEGAAALLLEAADVARARGARGLASIAGYGNATDAHHMTAPHPEGRGATAAVRQADLTGADWWCAHGTATPLNDAMEAGVLQALAPEVPVSSLKGAVGHTLGAAGAVEIAMAVLAIHRGRVPPNVGAAGNGFPIDVVQRCRETSVNAVVSANFAFGGHNAAVRLEAPVEVEPKESGRVIPTGDVLGWSALVPGGVSGLWDRMRRGELHTEVDTPARPSAIPAGRWRRMSRLSRLAAVAVLDLRTRFADLDWENLPIVHGTAMGEVVPSSRFLDRLFSEGPDRVSPMAFQNSVYNATAAHLSLCFGLRGPAETLSSGMATGLAALARGLEWTRRAPAVLIVVGDDLNPTTRNAYANTPHPPGESVVAVLVTPGDAVRVEDGVGDGWCRQHALPYEAGFVAGSGPSPESALGLNGANGLLALLVGADCVVDQDDALMFTGRRTPGRTPEGVALRGGPHSSE